jgi:hypothetical protein
MAMSAYLFGDRHLSEDDEGFDQAMRSAHATRLRPRCLCIDGGVGMYVANLGGRYILKRMPYGGGRHDPSCRSYELPPELSGLGHVMGTAIVEDITTGITSLRVGFAMSKGRGGQTQPEAGDGSGSVASDGARLTLRGLLHYLWDQAELNRWQPGFAGRRSWATVRKHLLRAADGKVLRGRPLRSKLYIPEVFSVEQRDEINARRAALWAQEARATSGVRPLMILIGEVKEIIPARYGFKAVIKHLPDQVFAMDEQLYRRMGKRFERELSLWGAANDLHMVVIATFGLNVAGVPAIEELSLMPVTAQWLPVEDAADRQRVLALVLGGRSFVKGLSYPLPSPYGLAPVVMTDDHVPSRPCDPACASAIHSNPDSGLQAAPPDG